MRKYNVFDEKIKAAVLILGTATVLVLFAALITDTEGKGNPLFCIGGISGLVTVVMCVVCAVRKVRNAWLFALTFLLTSLISLYYFMVR